MNPTQSITAFLSCSVREKDDALVSAIEVYLKGFGFRCLTVGRNYSTVGTPNESVKALISHVDCLIGIATTRYAANDIANPNNNLSLATPYINAESAMAYQADMPFIIFRASGVTLEAVAKENIYLTISENLNNGRIQFHDKAETVNSLLSDLRVKAQKYKNGKRLGLVQNVVGKVSALFVGSMATWKMMNWISQPSCFGEFYYKNDLCKKCNYKIKCKTKKSSI